MDKILFLNEKDRNTGLSLEHSDYRYKTAKPVAATKPKHDEVGFTIPYAMFRPIREPRACSVSCWGTIRCAAPLTSK